MRPPTWNLAAGDWAPNCVFVRFRVVLISFSCVVAGWMGKWARFCLRFHVCSFSSGVCSSFSLTDCAKGNKLNIGNKNENIGNENEKPF